MYEVFLLFSHRLTRLSRRPAYGAGTVAGSIILSLILLFWGIPLAVFGFLFPDVVASQMPGRDPLDALNQGLLPVALGLVVAHVVFQSSVYDDLRAYRRFPLRIQPMICAAIAASLPSIFNGYILLFLVPAWISTALPAMPTLEAGCWLIAVLSLLGTHHMLTLFAAEAITDRGRLYFGSLAVLTVAIVAELVFGVPGLFALSTEIFSAPLAACIGMSAVLASCVVGYVQYVRRQLSTPPSQSQASLPGETRLVKWVGQRFGEAGLVSIVSIRLLLRHRRTRAILLALASITVLFTSINGLIDDPDILNVGLWSMSGFPLLYSGLLYGADAGHIDRLLSSPTSARAIVTSNLVVLLGPTFLLGLAYLPIALAIYGTYKAGLLLAYLIYTTGVTCPYILKLAVRTKRPVDLDRSMFSMNVGQWHTLPIIVPFFVGMILMVVGDLSPSIWMPLVLGGLGLIGLTATPWVLPYLAGQLDSRRYDLVEAFHDADPI